MTTVGLLCPGHAAEDDFPRIEMLLGTDVRLPLVHADMGEPDRLAEGVAELRLAGAECVVWASASGSFMYGWDGAHEHTRALAVAAGLPASSTSFAFAHAVRALGVGRVAVAAGYPRDVTDRFVAFLKAAGTEVVSDGAGGPDLAGGPAGDGGEADSREEVMELARAADHPDAQAVLLPDTALHTVAYLPELEESLGKPVLTANQVTVWEGLRLTERRARGRGLGALFAGPE
ncbi:maleate cis-trans isomerase family protein [Streptomyces liangshanensis]|uniref:Decarboxylase n=1 Tax=Streptomyces liangshanensis TaxID=2717324 RepID=A0A6G9H2I2_9ACTN|nr:decarboxylase [Streptomyces liangshanensis]QIQ04680.1 decarboxylase [Streptomyces liangshanensis]